MFIFGFIAMIVGAIVGVRRYRGILAQQRNAAARYMPEYEARYQPLKLVKKDRPLGRITHGGGPIIDGRNDDAPHKRAKYWRALMAEKATEPPASLTPASPSSGETA